MLKTLFTEEGNNLPDVPWELYPRPQMRRDKWLCLNGVWDISWGVYRDRAIVPFPLESALSGVHGAPKIGEKITYTRTFEVPDDWTGRVILRFGAVMRLCDVFVNDLKAGHHDNGYLPFACDVTRLLKKGGNTLEVRVINDLDYRHAWGKQRVKRGGMWYTPCSGIWQTVWLEPVPETYLRRLVMTPDEKGCDIECIGIESGIAVCEGVEYPIEGGRCRIEPAEPELWSPENPRLYDFTIKSGEDEVRSYFGLRTLEIKDRRLCLNGKPYFFSGVLDQGYWSDGLYTPASPALFEKDISAMRAFGFNMLRKHIKIEPEWFYFLCDRLGMVVFQDMVSSGKYNYALDTAMPTVGVKNPALMAGRNTDRTQRAVFMRDMGASVRALTNHPSICLWTIFNEGWGEFEPDACYTALKKLDPTRFIDSASGWFQMEKSDVDSIHTYFDTQHLGDFRERAQFISEFGGYSYKIPEHSANLQKTYSYRDYASPEALAAALRNVYEKELLPLVPQGLCAAVYTQVSDVEDETNGFFTFDRAVLKVPPETLCDLNERLIEECK